MHSEIKSILESARPSDAASRGDIDDVVRRARRRRLRLRLAGSTLALLLIGLSVAAVVNLQGGSTLPPIGEAGPSPEELTEGLQTSTPELHTSTPEETAEDRQTSSDDRADDKWLNRRERDTWEEEHGRADWVAGYFYQPDHDFRASGDVEFDGLDVRWKRDTANESAADAEDQLQRALAELGAPPPSNFVHPLEDFNITLLTATLDDSRLTLEFPQEPWTQASLGTSGEEAILNQLAAVASHYFPEAEELCILVDGEQRPLFSHGLEPCPHQLPDSPA